jgi:hypothetical protein
VVYVPDREPIRVSTSAKPEAIHICTVNGHGGDAYADAYLIAAAPDLLAACEDSVLDMEGGWVTQATLAQIKAAIKKAKGP